MPERTAVSDFIPKAVQKYTEIYNESMSLMDTHTASVASVYARILKENSQIVNGAAITPTAQNTVLIGKEVRYTEAMREQFEAEAFKIIRNISSTKFNLVVTRLATLNGFYTALLYTMRILWVGGFHTNLCTMGVGVREIYVNAEFVYTLPVEELGFVILHELGHISGLHGMRQKKRDHQTWNEACDLYINKRIAEEYKLIRPPFIIGTGGGNNDSVWSGKYLLTEKNFPTVTVRNPNTSVTVTLRVPYHTRQEILQNPSLICGLFDPDVDIKNDTPESIYDRLKQDKQNASGGSQSSDGQGGGQQGSSGGNPAAGRTADEKQDSSGKGNVESKGNIAGKPDKGQKQPGQGGADSAQNQMPGSGPDDTADRLKKSMSKRLHDINRGDKSHKGNKAGNIEPSASDIQQAKGVLQQAVTRARLNGCNSGDMLMGAVELLKTKFNLKSLCRVYLKDAKSTKISYANINKRTMHTGYILPARGQLEKNKLDRIKICIDVSGSITQQNISQFLTLINSIMHEYNVSSELIFWDTECQSAGPVENFSRNTLTRNFDIRKYTDKVSVGGGTDPSCLFRYFRSKECRVKPYAVFILTDGYIGSEYQKELRGFRNILWIISDDGDRNFKSPAGIVKHWSEIEEFSGGAG